MTELQLARKAIAFDLECAQLSALGRELEQLPHWLPAAPLRRNVARREALLADARGRLEAKPVIAVVGPSGSGKSTLVNALAGGDALVATGNSRPTTRDIAVIARSVGDTRQLMEQIAHADLRSVSFPSSLLRNAILLDTPDTDSAECREHLPLLEKALQLSDVLLCVFDATNPKRRDNIEALAEWVNVFPGSEVHLVLNRCDRIPERELSEVEQDFLGHISRAWSRQHDRVFRVSARSGLSFPGWPDGEKPLHAINDLGILREKLNALGGGAFFMDRRIERAEHLRAGVAETVREYAHAHQNSLKTIRKELSALEHEVAESLADSLFGGNRGADGGVRPLLYGALAECWCGPVGFFFGLWRRLVDFWTPLSLLRSLNPVRFAMGVVRAFRALKSPEAFEQSLAQSLGREFSRHDCTRASILLAESWPDIADRLVAVEFDPAIRDASAVVDVESLLQLQEQSWGWAVKRAAGAAADRLSHSWLQALMNAPSVLAFAAVGYKIVATFIQRQYLPGVFFVHAAALLLILWLVPCWTLQMMARRSVRRVAADALEDVRNPARPGEDTRSRSSSGLAAELDRLIRLGL